MFEPSNSISPKIGASNKYFAYDSPDDVVYYDLPTPFTELMYRSVFEQGQLLDAIYSVNTSRQFNFSISRKGLRSLGNYQNFISSSSNLSLQPVINQEIKDLDSELTTSSKIFFLSKMVVLETLMFQILRTELISF